MITMHKLGVIAIGVMALTVTACGGTAKNVTPTTTKSVTTTTSTVPTGTQPRGPQIGSVDWRNVTLPGSVCGASGPIRLRQGRATIAAPQGVQAATNQVLISGGSDVVYGELQSGGQDVAALDVWCTNSGGTAEGQIENSWVIYSVASGTLRVLGTLVPRQPSSPKPPHVPYFESDPKGILIQPGSITVHELWYASGDGTCCPSIRATTVWTYADGVLRPTSTTHT
ncbi:MAG: hypothetical protein ACLP36_13550 [Acidimicrobiales bacterium]